ncbi:uncharacterized protein LOC141605860 [Silene latifolia]|uniref:uncharacterized protein LOC141605860 n=1 Tax=Silene latifolia TaxID=37657 RepID=UPI003D77E810
MGRAHVIPTWVQLHFKAYRSSSWVLFTREKMVSSKSQFSKEQATMDAKFQTFCGPLYMKKEDLSAQLWTLKKRLKKADEEQYRAEEDTAVLRAELNSIQQQAINDSAGSMGSPDQIHIWEKELNNLKLEFKQISDMLLSILQWDYVFSILSREGAVREWLNLKFSNSSLYSVVFNLENEGAYPFKLILRIDEDGVDWSRWC